MNSSKPYIRSSFSILWLALLLWLTPTGMSPAAIVFSDDFDGATLNTVIASGNNISGYNIKFSSSNSTLENFTAIFGYDYSAVTFPITIPSAPNSIGGTTKGLFLTVNKSAANQYGLASGVAPGTNAAVNLYPVGQSFSGNFKVKYDVWINWTNLTYSTEAVMVGINHSGNLTNQISHIGSDGIFTEMVGDGGNSATSTTARDFSLFQGKGAATAPLLYRTNNQAFAAILGTQFDHANPGFQSLFPDKAILGYTPTTGMPGMGWVTGEIWYTNNTVVWVLNNTVVAQFPNTNAYTSGNILLGYNDVFNSMGDTNDFAIFDNISVEDLGGLPAVSVTNTTPTATEGGVTGTFTLTRSGSTASPLTVTYTLSGTATHPTDYTNNPPASSVTFATGAATTNITVSAITDGVAEPVETVVLTVNAGGGNTVGIPGSATVAIIDSNPATVSITNTQPVMLESFASNRVAVTVNRIGLTNGALTVNLNYSAGTATLGADYNGPASVALAAGATSATFNLTPIDDKLVEGAETIIVGVTANGYTVGSPSATTVTITDDDLATAVTMFSDRFDSDTSANWFINQGGGDSAADFGFDYSAVGIPEAPSSPVNATAQHGLKLRANESANAVASISVSPQTGYFTNNYRLRFDMWLNYAGPLGNTLVPGQTQTGSAGVGTTGTEAIWPGGSATAGVWFSATSDGGNGSPSGDYNVYAGVTPYATNSGVFAAGTAGNTKDNGNAYYAPWNSVNAPATQTNLLPTQSGATFAGSLGMAWHCVTLTRRGTSATWDVDGRRLATVDTTALTLAENVFVGYHDPFASVTTNAPAQFGLFDNVRVESLAQPTLTLVQIITGGTQAQVDFTAETDDTPDLFELEKAAVVEGAYGPTVATFSALGGNKFRAVTAVGGGDQKQFYRVRRK